MLIAAINPTVAPIQYIDDDGNIIGLDVDLGNAIAERLCLKMDFQSTQFATMIPVLKEGRIDMINSFMFYTPERASPGADGALRRLLRWRSWCRRRTPIPIERSGLFLRQAVRDRARHGRPDQDAQAAERGVGQKAGKPPIDIHTFDTYADGVAGALGQVRSTVRSSAPSRRSTISKKGARISSASP